MAQNRDRNWQDEQRGQQGQRGGGWQQQGQHRGEDYGAQHTAGQGEGSWGEGHEGFGSGQQQGGWQGGGYGQQQGGEWNRMGRYGEEGWQGGGQGSQGRWGQGGNYSMNRDYGQQGYRGGQQQGSWGGGQQHGSSFGGGYEGQGMGRPFSGESSYASSRGNWGGGYGSYGGTGAYGTGRYGSSGMSGYGSSGYGSSGYGGMSGRSSQGQRGFWDRASDEVSSWFGDEQAQHRREQDEHRGRGPKGYTRSDERIREDVNDRFTDDGWLDASEITVQVSNAEVTLTGQVNSREDKRRAEDIAEAISGVKHVQNNLRVTERGAGSQTSAGHTGAGSSSGTTGTSTSKTVTGK